MYLIDTIISSFEFTVIHCDSPDLYPNEVSSNDSLKSFYITAICLLSLALIFYLKDRSDTVPVPLDELRIHDEIIQEVRIYLDSIHGGAPVQKVDLMWSYWEIVTLSRYYKDILANDVGSHLAPIWPRKELVQEYLAEIAVYMDVLGLTGYSI